MLVLGVTLSAPLEGVVAAVKDENIWVETEEGEEHPVPSVLDIDILATFISQLTLNVSFSEIFHTFNTMQ